jgi:hypothetical protein
VQSESLENFYPLVGVILTGAVFQAEGRISRSDRQRLGENKCTSHPFSEGHES